MCAIMSLTMKRPVVPSVCDWRYLHGYMYARCMDAAPYTYGTRAPSVLHISAASATSEYSKLAWQHSIRDDHLLMFRHVCDWVVNFLSVGLDWIYCTACYEQTSHIVCDEIEWRCGGHIATCVEWHDGSHTQRGPAIRSIQPVEWAIHAGFNSML